MNLTPEQSWAAKTALRLHIWQESLAEDDASTRGAAIWEYIAQALGELGDRDERFRSSSLRALDKEFPFYQERKVLGDAGKGGAGGGNGPQESKSPRSAQELVAALISATAAMPAHEKEGLARQLADAGITAQNTKSRAPFTGHGMPVQFPELEDEFIRVTKTVEGIQGMLGAQHFKSGTPVNLIRCLQMLGLMSEQFLQLHPQVWGMWEKIVTNHQYTTSYDRPPLSPDESLAQFLQGAPTTKRADVMRMVAKTLYLTVAAVSAVETAGREFAAWFFDKFGPRHIEEIMQFEAQGETPGPAEYWQRYVQLADTNSSEELSEQFLNLLGRGMLSRIQSKKP